MNLDYTDEQLESMTDEELEKLIKDCRAYEKMSNVIQQAKKVLINSLYGSLGHPAGRYYDLRMAESITIGGQLAIKWIARKTNEYLNTLCGTSNNDYVVYCDTDSVTGDTIIEVNGVKQTIESYFDNCDGELIKKRENDFVKIVSGDFSPSMSKDFQIEQKRVKHVMKHRVKKKMFKINVSGKSVTVTEDHSIMIRRGGELISAKPEHIVAGDSVIYLSNDGFYSIVDDFEVECIGVVEDWVYDIEIEDNHNFFANDILVHNSQYVSFENFVNMLAKRKGVDPDSVEFIKWVDLLDKFAKEKVEPYIDKSYRELRDYMNYYDHKLFMDREVIASKAFWTKKKRYAAMVWDNEGKRKLDKDGNVIPKLKIMGIETRRSSTPPFAAECLEKSIDIILSKEEKDLQAYVEVVREAYPKQDYLKIAQVSSANNIEKNHDHFVPVSGCPGHVKAAINYNKICHELSKSGIEIDPIRSGEKIQYAMLKVPNIHHIEQIAWPSGGTIPPEFNIDPNKDIDYSGMYCKHFQNPLGKICDAIGWSQESVNTLSDLFDFL